MPGTAGRYRRNSAMIAIEASDPAELSALLDAARQDRLRDGLVEAVTAIGRVLASHAPSTADDIDELPNKVVLL